MIRRLLARVGCVLRGHDYPAWPAWQHAGRGSFFRRRYCTACHRGEVETDG